MNLEAVFHTYDGYALCGLIYQNNTNYYIHTVDVYDGMILYSATPIDDNEAEILMRNEIELRLLVESATHTIQFNTTNSETYWAEVTDKTRINLPERGVYLYAK